MSKWIKNPWLKSDDCKLAPATAIFWAYPKEQGCLFYTDLKIAGKGEN